MHLHPAFLRADAAQNLRRLVEARRIDGSRARVAFTDGCALERPEEAMALSEWSAAQFRLSRHRSRRFPVPERRISTDCVRRINTIHGAPIPLPLQPLAPPGRR